MQTNLQKLYQMTEALIDRDVNMKKQNELLNNIIDVDDGYWDWDMETNYEYMSPRLWEIFGYDYREKKHDPKEWQQLIHPDDLEKVTINLDKHIKTKGEYPYYQEVRYKHKNGHWVWVLCKGKVIQWDGDKPLRMVGTHTDITRLKNR